MKLEFRCSIPQIQSALKFGGDTARITIEVPKCDVEKAVGMIALQGAALVATFEVDKNDGNTKEEAGAETEEQCPQNVRF